MKSLQALRENRAAKAKEARNLLDTETTVYTKEVEAKVDVLYAEIDSLDNQIQRIEKAIVLSDDTDARAADLHDSQGISKDEAAFKISAARKAFVKALRLGDAGLTPEERNLVSAGSAANRGRVQNVAEGTNTAGGFLVPTVIMPSLLIKLKYFGGMRSVANILATSNGYPIAWGTMDDTVNTGEIIAENVVATTSDLVFGQVTINAYKFSSKIIPVSLEILQDAAVDVETIVMNAIAMRIGRAQNTFFTTGTGTAQPQGVVTGSALGVTTAVNNAITYDNVIDTFHSVDVAYRASPNCAWMMNDLTYAVLKKLKDSQGRPIWLPTTESGFNLPAGAVQSMPGQQNGTIEGRQIVINNDMAVIATVAKVVLFGDFSKYLIRDVMDTLILRFTDSAYASKGQVGFLAWARADGRVIDFTPTAAIKYLQMAV